MSLHEAVENGDYPEVLRLIKSGAKVNERDDEDWTALEKACIHEYENIVELLIQNGASVNEKDANGCTLLHGASDRGHENVAQMLLQSGACVDEKDKNGCTPLHHTARGGHTRVAHLLLQSKASVNEKDRNDWTPLHYASDRGFEDIAELLLLSGARANEKDRNEWTPLHYASRYGHDKVAELLLQAGAKVTEKKDDGEIPLLEPQCSFVKVAKSPVNTPKSGAKAIAKKDIDKPFSHFAFQNSYENVAQMPWLQKEIQQSAEEFQIPAHTTVTLQKSNYLKKYDNAGPAKRPSQLLPAVENVILKYVTHLYPNDQVQLEAALQFSSKLQNVSLDFAAECKSGLEKTAIRMWTTGEKFNGLEFCSILNAAIREDFEDVMDDVLTLVHTMNLLLLQSEASRLLPRQIKDENGQICTFYRGVNFPVIHKNFYVEMLNQKYRVPMFLATTASEDVALNFCARSTSRSDEVVPVLFLISLDAKGCLHLLFLEFTQYANEKEFLFSPYSVFEVEYVEWRDHPTPDRPHTIKLKAVFDNQQYPTDLPCAPWA